jgi:hypothetical protein
LRSKCAAAPVYNGGPSEHAELGSLGGELGSLGGDPSVLEQDGVSLHGLGVRVDLEERIEVVQWVLLGASSSGTETSLSAHGLNFVGVDHTSDVGVGHGWVREGVALLGLGDLSEGSEHVVKLLEGRLGEDAESSQVATWCELEQVQRVDRGNINAWDVSETLEDAVILGVDDERTSTHDVTSVSELAFAGTQLLGGLALFDVLVRANGGEEGDGLLGLADRLDGVRDDARHLGDLRDTVTTGHDECWEGRSSQRRHIGESPLVHVDLSVPSTPDLGRGEHTSTSAHVTVSGGAGSGGTTTTNTWDTSDGSTGTPRLGGCFVTSILVHGVRLTLVLGNVGVDERHNIWTNWCLEHGWENSSGCSLTSGGVDGNLWTRSHCNWEV